MLCLADLSSIPPPHQAHMVSPGDMSEMVMVSLPPAVSPTADDEWIAVSPSLAPSKSKKEGVEVGPNPISRASNCAAASVANRFQTPSSLHPESVMQLAFWLLFLPALVPKPPASCRGFPRGG